MGISGWLSPIATVAGREQDRQRDMREQERQRGVAEVARILAEQRQTQQDQAANMLKAAQAREADARASALGIPKPAAPIMGSDAWKDAKTFEQGLKPKPAPTGPVRGSPEALAALTAEEKIRAQYGYHPPVQSSFSFPVVGGPDGPVVARANNKTGEIEPTTVAGKPAAGGVAGTPGGAKGMQYEALVGDIEQAIPIMTELSPKVSGAKIGFAIRNPMSGNLLLTTEEKRYITAARTFLSGVLHLESGARLSKEQWEIGAQRYLPLPDDPPEVKQQKINAARQTYQQRSTMLKREGMIPGTPAAAAPAAAASGKPPTYEEWKKANKIP